MSEAPDITADPTPTEPVAPTPPAGTPPTPPSQQPAGPDWAAFKESLPEDLRNDPSLKAIGDLQGLTKSYVHAQRQMGANKIILPGPNAEESEWNEVFGKLGRPEAPDKYGIMDLEEAKAFGDDESDKALMTEYQEFAHKNNLLPKQAQEMFKWWVGKEKEAATNHQQSSEQQKQQAFQELKQDWGADYDQNIEKAKVAFRQFADDKTIQALKDQGLHTNPTVLKLFAEIGSNMTEDVFKGQSISNLGMSREEAQSEITAAFSDPKGPYMNAQHPGHQAEVQRIAKLMSLTSQKS